MDKIILALETAVGQGSVSLLKGGELKGFRCGGSGATRSSDLVSGLAELLAETGIGKNEIDLIAVSTGPGSMTGARIGIATAKALAYALNCPCLGVSVLEALANNIDESTAGIVLPAGRGKYFMQFFSNENGERIFQTDICVFEEEELFSEISRLQPETLIFEKGCYAEMKNLLSEKQQGIKIEVASDNLAKDIGGYFHNRSAHSFIQSEVVQSEIEPLNIKADGFIKSSPQ